VPKIKTRKAAAKRFKVSSTGRIFRYRAKKKHLLEHKSKSVKRKLGKRVEVSPSDRNQIRHMLGGVKWSG
jgi:large subunit ribosomal protein L35